MVKKEYVALNDGRIWENPVGVRTTVYAWILDSTKQLHDYN